MAADQILSNEAMTADLDDEAAQALLDWAMSAVHSAVDRTAGLDETEAEQVMDEALPAVRRLMRAVRVLAVQPDALDEGQRQAYLSQMTQQAWLVYGAPQAPRVELVAARTLQVPPGEQEPAAVIASLRSLVEGQWAGPDVAQGQGSEAEHDQTQA
jgi:hypothetical protein